MPAAEFHLLWGGDKTPQFPDDGSMPEWRTYFPPDRRLPVRLVHHAARTRARQTGCPQRRGGAGGHGGQAARAGALHGSADPGMHTTDTIDFEVVLEGTIVLELDDGAEVTLQPGDTVVQNGTRHRWKNLGDKPARLALFICGASHAGIPPASVRVQPATGRRGAATPETARRPGSARSVRFSRSPVSPWRAPAPRDARRTGRW